MTTVKEITEYAEKTYPDFSAQELFAYITGYFDGVSHTMKDTLSKVKENLDETGNRS